MAVDPAADLALDHWLHEAVLDDALMVLDPQGTLVRRNPGAEALYALHGAARVDLTSLYPPDDRGMGAPSRERRAAEHDGPVSFEAWQCRLDGSRFFALITASALRDDSGRVLGYARHVRDITERLLYEETIRRSEERFEGVVALASEGIVSVDEAQRIVLFNRGAELIFGYTAHEVLGEPLARLLPAPVRASHESFVAAFAATGATARPMGARAEVRGVRKSGEEFPAEASISVMLDRSGARIFTAVLRDISARRAAEQEIHRLLEAESDARARAEAALSAHNDLLSVVAHDFGNALTAAGFHAFDLSQSLEAHGLEEERGRAGVILAMIEHLGRLQRDLVDGAALQAGRLRLFPAAIDARRVLHAAAELYDDSALSRHLELRLDLPNDPLFIPADSDRLLQVVGNLLSNAIRHSPREGTISLSAAREGDAAVIRVADEGPGIAPDDLPHVFEPFWTRGDRTGTGLGLTIARGIVEAHGGTLAAANGPARGAVLRFTLPLAADVPEPAHTPPAAEPTRRVRKRS